jgi:hypothetical protein
MSSLTYRLVKGSPLTNAEIDQNFQNLNNDKLEGTVSISNGGTGATTLAAAQVALNIQDPVIYAIALG